jgi:hypothetical protein
MGLFPAIPNTDWTLVERAAEASSTPQKVAMHTLLTLYYPALRAYVVSKWSIPQERAEEYLQEFLATKVVGENLIGQARKERGRFRNFIRATLDDFVVSLMRRESAKKRSPGNLAPLACGDMVVDRGPSPRQAFEIAWAREVIAAAVEAMKQECQRTQRPDLWALFETRILQPALDGSTPVAYDLLVEKFRFRSPLQAANALTTAKRMLERNLRLILSSYSSSEGEVDEEICDLRMILSMV